MRTGEFVQIRRLLCSEVYHVWMIFVCIFGSLDRNFTIDFYFSTYTLGAGTNSINLDTSRTFPSISPPFPLMTFVSATTKPFGPSLSPTSRASRNLDTELYELIVATSSTISVSLKCPFRLENRSLDTPYVGASAGMLAANDTGARRVSASVTARIKACFTSGTGAAALESSPLANHVPGCCSNTARTKRPLTGVDSATFSSLTLAFSSRGA